MPDKLGFMAVFGCNRRTNKRVTGSFRENPFHSRETSNLIIKTLLRLAFFPVQPVNKIDTLCKIQQCYVKGTILPVIRLKKNVCRLLLTERYSVVIWLKIMQNVNLMVKFLRSLGDRNHTFYAVMPRRL